MRSQHVPLLLLASVFAAIVRSSDVTATSPQSTRVSYVDVIERYRRGDDDLALKQLSALTDSDIRISRKPLIEAISRGNIREAEHAAAILRAAAVLHTVKAFAARAHYDPGEFSYHFGFAHDSIDAVMSRERKVSPFVQTWRLFVLASYHGQRGVKEARQFGRGVRDPPLDSPLLLLALGAPEDMGWAMHQDEDAQTDVDGDLKDAEGNYREALVIAPDLIEARLRLGRVLALRKDEGAIKIFEQIGASIETPYQYLARLFEGEVYERAGKPADAERQYLAAVTIMPESQSAFIALAHVRHAQGARAQAAQDVRVTAGARAVPDTADPWFWYSRGTAWRGTVYLDDLRKMIAP